MKTTMSRIFSNWGSMLFSLLAGLAAVMRYRIDDFFGVSMVTLIGVMVTGKFLLAFSFLQGSTMTRFIECLEKNRKLPFTLRVFKAPAIAVVMAGIVLALSLSLVWSSFHYTIGGDGVARALSLTVLCGTISAILHWLFNWREYYYLSEYQTRLRLKHQGKDEETIEQVVQAYRQKGFFGPQNKQPTS